MVYNRLNIKRFLDHFLAGICLLCHGTVRRPFLICQGCRRDLPYIDAAADDPCPEIDRIVSTFSYSYPIKQLIRQLKYDQKIIIATELGLDLAVSVLEVSTHLPECILPVPLHRYRYISRGYNQSLEIANAVSRRLRIPVDYEILVRNRNTLAQFELDPRHRKQNVRNAFSLKSRPEYKSIAILDDVITTGSTVNEIARLLKRSGVRHIEAWACARTEKSGYSL